MSILADTVTLEHAHTPARARAADRVWSRAFMAAAAAIVVVAPFERPVFAVGGSLTVTTSEAATSLALVVAAVCVAMRRQIVWPVPMILSGSAFVAAMALAALAAPMEQGNALRFAARMIVAAAVCVLFVNVATTTQRARAIVRVALGIAAVVAAIAVLEQAEVPAVLAGLTAFRPGFHVVAGQMRATSTLIYPTITSMYLEVVFALGLWLLLEPVSRRPRLERSLVFAALVTIGAGISATFTRAGLIGMFVAMILVAGFRMVRMQSARWNLRPMATLGVVLVAVVVVMHSVNLLAVRLGTEGSQAWYGAQYRVPATVQLKTGAAHSIPIVVTNSGRLTWDSAARPPFAMSYHWLRAESDAVIQYDGERTPFARPVRPGDTVRLPVTVVAPGEAGSYVLVWDVVHETRAWLSTESVTPARTMVNVAGAKSSTVVTRMSRLPIAPIRPARPELWAIALRMSAERPWLGLGPDNFRLAYGRYAGFDRWDPRVHANNMYLETLTGAGLIGLVTLLWLVAASGSTLWRRARHATEASLARSAAMLAAWLMIAGHGLVDSFLSFTTTYLTFAMALGLAFSPGLTGVVGGDADRV